MGFVSARGLAAVDEFATVRAFFERNAEVQGEYRSGVCDFTFGNPHEMPLPGLVAALRKSVEPEREDWFAYKTSEAEPRTVVADALTRELGLTFEPEDVALTAGRLRGDRARLPPGDGRGRRGDHPGARLVLLRADAAHCRPRAGEGAAGAGTLRSRSRRHRRRDHPADTDGGGELAAQSYRADLSPRRTRGARRPARTGVGADRRADSGCSPTSPTGASGWTATASPAPPPSIPGP